MKTELFRELLACFNRRPADSFAPRSAIRVRSSFPSTRINPLLSSPNSLKIRGIHLNPLKIISRQAQQDAAPRRHAASIRGKFSSPLPLFPPVQMQPTSKPLKPAKNHINRLKPDQNHLTLFATFSSSATNHINHLFRKKSKGSTSYWLQTSDCFERVKNSILGTPAMKTPTLSILAALSISSAI